MKEPYRQDLASQPDPESCAGDRKVAGEALTGAHAGQPLSSEITESGVPTQSLLSEGYAMGGVKASRLSTPRSHRPCACVETPCAGTGRSSRHPWRDGARDRSEQADAVRPTCTSGGSRMLS